MAQKYSPHALIDFCTGLAVAGMPSRQAAALATACREVFSIEHDLENHDIRDISIETRLHRFAQLRPHYRPATLAAYKSRFRKAISWYLEHLDDPSWDPRDAPKRPLSTFRTEATLQRYDFPLRKDTLITLSLPRNMNRSEAKRLARYVETLGL